MLLRRKYYQNGAHTVGNTVCQIDRKFPKPVLHGPNGKTDGINILQLSEVTTQNAF